MGSCLQIVFFLNAMKMSQLLKCCNLDSEFSNILVVKWSSHMHCWRQYIAVYTDDPSTRDLISQLNILPRFLVGIQVDDCWEDYPMKVICASRQWQWRGMLAQEIASQVFRRSFDCQLFKPTFYLFALKAKPCI